MSDLIERLRTELVVNPTNDWTAFAHDIEAACKEIERLEARVAELEGALREIALDTTNPTNQISWAAERAEKALRD